jgi:hypothetical protein
MKVAIAPVNRDAILTQDPDLDPFVDIPIH